MSAWIGVVASYLPEIIQLAKPLFTRTKAQGKAPDRLLEQQIAELQNAATQNAEAIKKLALDLQHTVEALQLAATRVQQLEQRLRGAYVLAGVAMAIAALTLGVSLYALR